ncbi:TonB-dependent receptor [Chryseotalea sanaruensis]|uniref:TonB-dependent receptor n=2 Tax=Chryseotalea sanaruensis TaxID=2482724 RepID=A0A401U650_9BACT|nr:TonB-dependent receptor [Chryseotalea sanaruensis]
MIRYLLATVTLILLSASLQAQGLVKGKVSDESGVGMPGVNIIIKGTASGTTTDSDGNYSIQVSGNQTVLVYSFIGHVTQEQTVNGRTIIDVSMPFSASELSEIIVVGYGTQKKSDVTGSIVRVTEESLKEVPVANISQALQGRAAGVEINSTSSRPGAGAQIRIRGSRSLSATNDPLIVLDGIPFNGTINDVNPSDIVSLDVLKDASATAIYGSRGSNGVILITTKRGKSGQAQLFYDGYYGVSNVIGKYDVYNGVEFDAFRNAAVAAGAAYVPTADEVANLAAGRQTDWQDELYKSGFITNHSIGTSGGTDETQFAISAGYFKQTTVLPGQAFARYSLSGVIDQKIGERIKVGLNTMNSFNINDGEGVSPMFSILTLSPLYSARNPDGTILELPALGSANPETRNPLLIYRDNTWKQQRRRLRTFNSLYSEVKLAEGFKYRINVGLDLFQDNYGQYTGSNTPFANGGTNTADVENTNSWSYTIENLLLYEKTFAEKHKLGLTGLFSVQETEDYRSGANANTLPADYTFYYNLGLGNVTSVPAGTSYYAKSGLLSYMGRANYTFSDRYLITATARADGSSRLAEGNKWFYYPALALGWIISNESFMNSQDVVSSLKLRFGTGRTSNQAVNPYASLGSLASEPYNYGNNGLYGFFVNALPNPDLRWEFTTTTNVALDFGLFQNRLTGTVELYKQNTEDILQRVSLPNTSGVASVVKNVGKTENKGFELMLNSVNVESSEAGGFNWYSDLNIFLNRNEVVELANGVTQDITNGWHVGHPIDAIFDYEKIGVWQTGETGAPAGFNTGEIKIKDQNTDNNGDGEIDGPDGIIDAKDRVILGSAQAKWSGGLTNRFTYKGFDLSVVLFWRVGGMLVSTFYQSNISNPINSLEGRRNGPKVDYWTPSNPTNAYPSPGLGQVPDFGSTLGYFDATYMKIRTISLGYNLPTSWLGKTGISKCHLYVQAQNPFKAFFSDYVKAGGLDPETSGAGGSVTEGFGPNGTNRLTVQPNTPPTKSFIVGINIKY